MGSHTSKVALVTGASKGIGAELAAALSEQGYAVGLVARDAQRLEQVAESLPHACVAPADVTDPRQAGTAVATVTDALGDIDVLVNNAGLREERSTLPWEADPTDWWRVVEVNLRGVVVMTSAVLPRMLANGAGRIIDVNSGAGQRAEPRYSAYSVSKAAALHWMHNVVAGLGDASPIRVVAASPGLVHTDMTDTMWGPPGSVDFGEIGPMRRFVCRFADGELDHLHGTFVHTAREGY